MEITSVQVRVEGFLRPGDPVPITVHLPEGDVTVEGWVRDAHFEVDWTDHQYHSAITFYIPRQRGQLDVEIDEASIEAF